ncbi:MAG: hypothetical protein N2Z76_07130 [Treponemataceae bacterium]|nr:hypothetical protein [Treponemataceae bacterium]
MAFETEKPTMGTILVNQECKAFVVGVLMKGPHVKQNEARVLLEAKKNTIQGIQSFSITTVRSTYETT